jgi:hypothetical protein
MRQRTQYIMNWLLGGLAFAGATACSGDDDTKSTKETEKAPVENEVKVRRLTITEVEGDATNTKQAHTRATLEENESGLVPSWKAGDELTYCNLSRMQYNGKEDVPVSGNLTATTTAATSQFTGNVTCIAGDYLAVVYPAATFTTNSQYTIALSGQDGTLATLATNFHYVYGRAHVTSVTETTANATMEKMKSLLTVCKFSFKDKATGDALPITTLEISYGGNPEIDSRAGKYPQAATVAISYLTDPKDTHASGTNITAPLTISAGGATEVYVGLLPDSSRKYNFTVANASGTYAGTATATLTEGEYVAATGLKLTKQ